LTDIIIVCGSTFFKWLKNMTVPGSNALMSHKRHGEVGSKKYLALHDKCLP
jgi:hypothetical protein